MAGENSAGPLHEFPMASVHPVLGPALMISSPVLILGGPSPAASELSQRLRGIDVKVLLASSAETARQALQVDAPELFVVDARSSRRVGDLERVMEGLRASTEPSAVLHWFDADVELERLLETVHPQDDHMAGSISVQEALRRLHLITARLPERTEGERLLVGDLELDTAARTVRRGGRDIDLSDTEFRLLRLLMRHARTVLPKAEILQQVWEYEFAGQANIVELYISYVRKKIEVDMPRMIHTVRGAGYVLRPADHGPSSPSSASSAGSP
ncbi:response regulator transcription factor [Nesterenkonia sp. YGD6]|uniref:winged helix-turn-helix transcriptional regulator n=1 Tax=Nesterenkonia sp. YGD6 TaxID=2901231 RepID=UPI001F4CFE54|nr:response regulator transcription factor [Nesterenkonia sp. YGD6]MCH8562188.1 response regulator transcription factor [Nesterenkonia sp. YGD6]